MHPLMATWKFIGSSVEGARFEIRGVDVWSQQWVRDLEWDEADVKEPLYGQSFTFHVYRIQTVSGVARFAAGEFSNGVFGFFVAEPQNA
jgi:hypothetical protein